jgi:sulfur transfer complex TusBCD TusB component (DsrH family)
MVERFLCSTCEQVEEQCKCDRYCYLCMSEDDVRLTSDGCYYCLVCREACDYTPEQRGSGGVR